MGYGVPAAIGMKRLTPERPVVAFAGDGDFLMTGQEFATAVQYDLPVIVVVVDNGMYGTIRMHQERHYPGRVIGDRLEEPGFRRLCPRLRRLRRDGGEDRGFLSRLRGRAEIGQARDPPSQGRSRGAHPDDVAHRHPREGAGSWVEISFFTLPLVGASRPIGRIQAVELAQEARPFRAEGRIRGDRELGGVRGHRGRTGG